MKRVTVQHQRTPHSKPRATMTHSALLALGFVFIIALASVAYAAYHYGEQQAKNTLNNAPPHPLQKNLDALTAHLGLLQAELIQLDELGRQLVQQHQLNADEYAFNLEWDTLINDEALLSEIDDKEKMLAAIDQINRSLEKLTGHVHDRKAKLNSIKANIIRKYRTAQILPAGWPVKQGYVTSSYGMRTTARGTHFHKGIDIAAPRGTAIYSVADGVVVRSGVMRGYGNIVEIKHSDTYSTRYAHNSQNMVKVGQKVTKGQTIALMGSTGRASGAHLHFEVLQENKAINPVAYLQATDTFELTANAAE